MKRRDEVELLAKFFNSICNDWPPISVDWSGKGCMFAFRRREMRELAREFIVMRTQVEEAK